MRRYSKPLGKLLDFKQDFFEQNDARLEELDRVAALYLSQPRRLACKNCGRQLDGSPQDTFEKARISYILCSGCGHYNGVYEDTNAFCREVYAQNDGECYAMNYTEANVLQYRRRVTEIYLPKAGFLVDGLKEVGENPQPLVDFGAGAGYFVSAALQSGFDVVCGYEPSKTLVRYGNTMSGTDILMHHDIDDVVDLVDSTDAPIVSFIGVLEHLQKPRDVLQAIRNNRNIRFVFFSVPLFSASVVFEAIFPRVMPRHLAGGHTHLYTEESIQHLCDEFGLRRLSEWWFGLDICDLSRSVMVSLNENSEKTALLRSYWNDRFDPLIDRLQGVLDESHLCSEVHMLLGK